MLCLTVYESKGLEFNDVIIYNFFDESEAGQSQWRLINDVEYSRVMIPFLNEDALNFEEFDQEKFDEYKKKAKILENFNPETDSGAMFENDDSISWE